METKTRKTTMIGAALAVAIIALAGVGYAVTYTATSSNTGNNLTATYVELSQTGDARYNVSSFLQPVYFNTNDKQPGASGFDYTVVKTHALAENAYTPSTDQTAATCAIAGKGLTLNAKNVGAEPTTVELVIKASSGFNVASGLTYTMIIGEENPTSNVISVSETATFDDDEKTWTFSSLTLPEDDDVDWSLFLFISGTSTAVGTGFASSNVQFTFTLTATA